LPMKSSTLTLTALAGLPLIRPGDDLAALLGAALEKNGVVPANKDVLVIAQKIVSKAEGRFVDLNSTAPSERTQAIAQEVNKDARLVEVILSESAEIIRKRRDVLIVAHRLGFVMANAGVDQSNVAGEDSDQVLLLPRDPDASAAALKARLDRQFGVDLGIVINDSFGRAWRNGVVGVAIGAAGIPVIRDMVGVPDLFGRKMRVTEIGLADEIASAASLLMGQGNEGQPAIHLRGLQWDEPAAPAAKLLRPKETDLFR
jgi:coenzyme F420-0:L-glutamate ligase / coenzyme F420-1:gamma-L-glutamate ligase